VRAAAKDRGCAVLVEQHAHKALQYADRAIVMRRGGHLAAREERAPAGLSYGPP
jgi:ABC-type branched-subunit amino acid transport system ATPase component